LAKDSTYADEMTEKAKEHLRMILEEALTELQSSIPPPQLKSICQCCGERTIDYLTPNCNLCGTKHYVPQLKQPFKID
jgi:hypothetical protein